MKTHALTQRLSEVIEPTLVHMGYALVRVQMQGMGNSQALQIMAERIDAAPISVDDCEAISKQVSAILDVEDVIAGAYRLEVSSPGIDRPLTRLNDFERFKGFLAAIELFNAPEWSVTGRKRFQGTLKGIEGNTVKMQDEDAKDEIWNFDFSTIAKAKLVLTDKLIKAGVSN